MWIFTAALVTFFALELLYFKIANHFDIIDEPNQRSSHTQITLRGGGIIFPIAFIIGITIWQPSLWIIGLAVLLIATISFLDDVLTLNNKLRIAVHVISVLLLLYQVQITNAVTLHLSPYSLLLILLFLILIIGIINAYNFMDGINGITVLYSITSIFSIWYVQIVNNIHLLENNIWFLLIASLIVFGFFNMRKKAKAFAGDIGSIAMALILCFLILILIDTTKDLKWLLLLGIYGLDTVGTIICRIIRKENIFEAHRSHFYQFLANEKKIPHVIVALIYTIAQIILNLVLITSKQAFPAVVALLMILTIYIILRLLLEGKNRLFKNYILA